MSWSSGHVSELTPLAPGRHIRVRRQLRLVGLPYWHHGIGLDDSRIIEFGGGNLWNKAQTQIREVSPSRFAQGGSVEVVRHPIKWFGLTYSPLLPPEQVVDRAEWLLHNQPPTYRLGYRNCESIALWCATGDFESFQVKAFMLWRTVLTLPVMVLLKKKPGNLALLAVTGITVSLFTAVPYINSWAFFNHTRLYPGIGNWTPKPGGTVL
ncbi:MAG TPA: lecithin retinol acyltransferase family protein [Acidimicrobiales bacterium]|nr:lecithin retinol acyltransferase family protein [Acidimicrobiales bacterium]